MTGTERRRAEPGGGNTFRGTKIFLVGGDGVRQQRNLGGDWKKKACRLNVKKSLSGKKKKGGKGGFGAATFRKRDPQKGGGKNVYLSKRSAKKKGIAKFLTWRGPKGKRGKKIPCGQEGKGKSAFLTAHHEGAQREKRREQRHSRGDSQRLLIGERKNSMGQTGGKGPDSAGYHDEKKRPIQWQKGSSLILAELKKN